MLTRVLAVAVAVAAIFTQMSAQNAGPGVAAEAACQTLTPAAVGGPTPKDPNHVVIRWFGNMNYEIATRDAVLLMNAYYERVPNLPAMEFEPNDVRKADAILVGHAHFDHIADAARLAKQTGAPVVGAVSGSDYLRTQGVPEAQLKTVAGGERLEFRGVTVQPVLVRHSDPAAATPPGYLERVEKALAAAALDKPLTDAQKQQASVIRARMSQDPKIPTEGTIGYLLTLSNSFRIMFVDSSGAITDAERQVAQRTPDVDVALLSFNNMDAGIPPVVEAVRLFRPTAVMLGRADGPGTMRWASTFLAATAIREVRPRTRTVEVSYRTPVCFDTATKELFVGQ